MNDKDLRLQIRIKNNLLYKLIQQKMQELDVDSMKKLFSVLGYNKDYQHILGYLNFSRNPFISSYLKNDEYVLKNSALEVLEVLQYFGDPLEIYSPKLYSEIITNVVETEISSNEFLSLDSTEVLQLHSGNFEDMQKKTDLKIAKKYLYKGLSRLSKREREILIMRFGLKDGVPHTLKETGNAFGVSMERIRQSEQRAFQKLREHPESIKYVDVIRNY